MIYIFILYYYYNFKTPSPLFYSSTQLNSVQFNSTHSNSKPKQLFPIWNFLQLFYSRIVNIQLTIYFSFFSFWCIEFQLTDLYKMKLLLE